MCLGIFFLLLNVLSGDVVCPGGITWTRHFHRLQLRCSSSDSPPHFSSSFKLQKVQTWRFIPSSIRAGPGVQRSAVYTCILRTSDDGVWGDGNSITISWSLLCWSSICRAFCNFTWQCWFTQVIISWVVRWHNPSSLWALQAGLPFAPFCQEANFQEIVCHAGGCCQVGFMLCVWLLQASCLIQALDFLWQAIVWYVIDWVQAPRMQWLLVSRMLRSIVLDAIYNWIFGELQTSGVVLQGWEVGVFIWAGNCGTLQPTKAMELECDWSCKVDKVEYARAFSRSFDRFQFIQLLSWPLRFGHHDGHFHCLMIDTTSVERKDNVHCDACREAFPSANFPLLWHLPSQQGVVF